LIANKFVLFLFISSAFAIGQVGTLRAIIGRQPTPKRDIQQEKCTNNITEDCYHLIQNLLKTETSGRMMYAAWAAVQGFNLCCIGIK